MILFYHTAIRLAATTGNSKAQQWIKGRENLFGELRSSVTPTNPWIWVHCASAGELEQGKPVIERLKERYPNYKILISFFSPSGYKAGKKYAYADAVCYLPADTKQKAEEFLHIVQPQLVVFVKYEYWYYHLKAVQEKDIPLLLVSAIFRKEQAFFKWYGTFYKKLLHLFSWIFVQDETSSHLLKENGVAQCSVAGDTRFDRVIRITTNAQPVAYINDLFLDKPILIAGSTWPDDEKLLAEVLREFTNLQLVIAPHEITPDHISDLQNLYPHAILYSQLQSGDFFKVNDIENKTATVLIVDNVGMLSRLYQHATITYIGGGFNKSGIHNTLEAAVWGKPVLFGPHYQKFKEARDLISVKGAFSIYTETDLKQIIKTLLKDISARQQAGTAAKEYVHQSQGATEEILRYIQEKRLLTS